MKLTWQNAFWPMLIVTCGAEWLGRDVEPDEIENGVRLGLLAHSPESNGWVLTERGRKALRQAVAQLLTPTQERALRWVTDKPLRTAFPGLPADVKDPTLRKLANLNLLNRHTAPSGVHDIPTYTPTDAGRRLAAAIANLPREEMR